MIREFLKAVRENFLERLGQVHGILVGPDVYWPKESIVLAFDQAVAEELGKALDRAVGGNSELLPRV